MTTFHKDLRKTLNYVNVIALVAIGAYVWTDYNEDDPAPPKPRVSHLQSPIKPTGTQQLITVRAIGVTDGVTVLDESNTPHLIRLPSDPNSLLEFIDRLKPAPLILPFIEKTPETKETNVQANENRTKVSPRQLSVFEQEQDSYVAG